MVIAEHTASDQLPEEDDKRGSENGIQEDNSVTVTESRQTVAPAQSKVTAAKKTKTAARLKAPVYHRVKKGDTLSAIARRHGVSVEQLCTLNKIQKTTTLKVGRSLRCS
ncbi:LysM peptidoglycan-binding domain-containing protein [Tannerella forsythia]